MNFIDILFGIPLIYFAYKGFKNGLIIELFTLLALLVGVYAGIHFSDFTAELIKDKMNVKSTYLPVVAFTFTFIGVGAMIYFGGKVLEKMVSVAHLSIFNKLAGVAFAIIKTAYFLGVFVVLMDSYDEKGDFIAEETKSDSLLYKPVKSLSFSITPYFKESSIFIKNAMKEEQKVTGLSIKDLLRAKEVADSLGVDANDAMELKRLHEEYGQK
jgi:membrane protein required for colicin V production